MGYLAHDAVVVMTSRRKTELPDIEAFRQSLPAEFRRLVIGPIEGTFNGYFTYAFLPDDSKEGWPASDAGDRYRKEFCDLFDQRYDDGSTHDSWVAVRFGGAPEYGDTARVTEKHETERWSTEDAERP